MRKTAVKVRREVSRRFPIQRILLVEFVLYSYAAAREIVLPKYNYNFIYSTTCVPTNSNSMSDTVLPAISFPNVSGIIRFTA